MKKKIVILGASPDPDRYANKAIHMAVANGLDPILVNPKYDKIDGFPVLPSLQGIAHVDYLSVYLSYPVLEKIIEDIVSLNPKNSKKIILNPGADSPEALELFKRYHLSVTQACTLVLLSTKQIP